MKGRFSDEEDKINRPTEVIVLSAEDEQLAAGKVEDIYRALSDDAFANQIVIHGQTLKATSLNYPLNFLLSHQELPPSLRLFNLYGYELGDWLELGKDSPVETIDSRCMGFFHSASTNEDLIRYMSLLPRELRFYIGAVIFNIQGDIDDRKKHEIMNITKRTDLDFMQETRALKAVALKYDAIESRIASLLDIDRIKAALLKAQSSRPCFHAYIDAVNKIACIKTKDETSRRIKIENLSKIRKDELSMLNDHHSLGELEKIYEKLTLDCESTYKSMLPLVELQELAIATTNVDLACQLNDFAVSDSTDYAQLEKIANELIRNIQPMRILMATNAKDGLLECARNLKPIVINQYRRLLLDKNICQYLKKLLETDLANIPNYEYLEEAQAAIQTLIDILNIIRAEQLWKSTHGHIDAKHVNLIDADNMRQHCLDQIEVRISDLTSVEENCEYLTSLVENAEQKRTSIMNDRRLKFSEKIPGLLSICRDLGETPSVALLQEAPLEDLCSLVIAKNDITQNLKGAILLNLLKHYKCFETNGIQLEACDLHNQLFSGICRPECNFSKCNFTNTTFHDNNLHDTNFSFADFTKAEFSSCDLRQCNFESCKLIDTQLNKVLLCGSKMVNADLTKAKLVEASLENVDFSNASLCYANLSNAKLYGANFTKANLNNAVLIDADLGDVKFEQTSLNNAQFISFKKRLDPMDLHLLLETWKKHRIPVATGFYNITENIRNAAPAYNTNEKLNLLRCMENHDFFKPDPINQFGIFTNYHAIIQSMIQEHTPSPEKKRSPKMPGKENPE